MTPVTILPIIMPLGLLEAFNTASMGPKNKSKKCVAANMGIKIDISVYFFPNINNTTSFGAKHKTANKGDDI
ncbi:MAG: hypothetical protein VW986_04970 [Gammaproteobacteria bacterium]